MPSSLQDWNDHFEHLYGRRNAHFLPGIGPRLRYFALALGDAQDAVRVKGVSGVYALAIARLVCRAFMLGHQYPDLPLVEAMVSRFGGSACGYCRKTPCDCPDVGRDDITLRTEADPHQAGKGLYFWQKHLNALYGEKNAQHGIQNILSRLFREYVEFQSIVDDTEQMCFREPGESVKTLSVKLAHELADVFAWIFALATALRVDAAKAVDDLYRAGCPDCKELPCICTNLEFRLADWKNLPPERRLTP